MNRDEMIINAIGILKTVGIVKTDKKKNNQEYIEKSFRSQISPFGAAVEMGSLLSAVAFFSNKGGSDTDRPKLMQAIYMLITNTEENCNEKALLDHVANNNTAETKKNVIDAAVALKLAMNAYELRDKDDKQKSEDSGDENKES